MNKQEWTEVIKEACDSAGTYKPFFDSVIDTLADIMAKRDDAQVLFELDGARAVVEHTNKGGATNIEQNPCLRLINDLNRDALKYWSALGLTAHSYKQMFGSMKVTKDVSLEDLLSGIGV